MVPAQRRASIFTSSKLNHSHIGIYLKTHLFPKLITPLACSHLSTTQHHSIQQQYITSAISSMGYNKTWHLSLRYGDHKYCGLQLKHLETEALIRKISDLRILLFKPHTSQLVLAMLAWYQHVSGISYPVLKKHSFTMHHINSIWINALVRLLKHYKLELKLRDALITKHQRHNDRHILDNILTRTSSILSRKKILACRLYLQITLLSDITDIKGTSLIPNVLIGTRSINRHQTSSWPLQQKPNSHSWKVWKRTLRSI